MFHQGIVDASRAALLIPLGLSVLRCSSLPQCVLVGTVFLLLVTVSTVNMLTSVLNDAPITSASLMQEQTEDEVSSFSTPTNSDATGPMARKVGPMLLDSPQCVLFGMFMIWFASFTINLGPTFLSGALSTWTEPMAADSCPLITESLQHYVLSVLWIVINGLCVMLTAYHLRKLHRDLTKSNLATLRIASLVSTIISIRTENEVCEHQHIRNQIKKMEEEGLQRIRMFVVIIIAYVAFWAPLSAVIIIKPMLDYPPMTYQIAIHIAFMHSFVNPALLLGMHQGMRHAIKDIVCCTRCSSRGNNYSSAVRYSNSACALNRSYM